MDRVRFGRALGYGARHAAKSVLEAVDAASAPDPASAASRAATPQPQASRMAQRVVQTQRTVAATKTHARTLGRSVWSPLARFSSVLWLQVTGTFFMLIAAFLSQGLWKERGAVRLPMSSHAAVMFDLQMTAFVVFAYFAISNFVRAHLRERR
jgi:hypothetical protein